MIRRPDGSWRFGFAALASATLSFATLSLSIGGCFLDRNGLAGVDAAAVDAAGTDGGRIDSGREDARVVAPDGSGIDAQTPCTAADQRCDGTARLLCEAGSLRREECGATRHCEEGGGGPACVDDLCVPSTTRCSADGAAVLTCDLIGATESSSPCTRGCDAGACRPQTACGVAVFATVSSGTTRVDLCGAGADQTHTSACPYAEQAPAGEDVVFRIEVDRRRAIRFQAVQVSSGETIDPTLYLRRVCDDMGSEVWCREDTSGQDEDFTETLDPGDYFLVVDRHERAGTSCGQLDVTITPT